MIHSFAPPAQCGPRESLDEVWLPTPAPTPSDGGLGVCRRLREARPGGRPQSCTAARRQGRVRMTMKGPPHRCEAARRAKQQVSARTPARRTSRVVRMHLSSARASRGAAMHYPQYLHTRAAEFVVTHTILHPVARARRAPRPVRSPRQSPVLDLSPVVFHASTTVAVQVSNTTDRQRCCPPPQSAASSGPYHVNIEAWRAAAEWVSSSRRCVDGLVSVAGLAAA